MTTPRGAPSQRRRPGPAIPQPDIAPPDEYAAAWAPPRPDPHAWTPRPWVTVADRAAYGKVARQASPRRSHAAFEPAASRDPVAIILAQEADRLPELLPLRHGRMASSAFAFYRGAPAVMAFDLSTTPTSQITVQASGDAHLSNFGLFASPERTLVFDSNDFDETLPGPWEWDVKRLAASVVIASRSNGFTPAATRTSALATVRAYREQMARYSEMRLLQIWYDRTTAEDITAQMVEAAKAGDPGFTSKEAQSRVAGLFAKARGKDQLKASGALTETVDGKWRIRDDPPVVQHIEIPGGIASLSQAFSDYRASLAESRRELVERYRFVDFALKVVGVGSVGTRCFVALLEGRDEADPLFLQAKEATASVLDPYVETSHHQNHGERVVVGQRLMQATPDIFLGWSRGPGGRDFYFRQLWDMKGSVDTATLQPRGMAFYGGLCARSLARAHARTGDSVAIASYLGTSDTFDGALADFAESYADQNDKDHAAFLAAIAAGDIATQQG
ncbi:MAG: DUF2252 domain-containing protein [Chloroflexota bacterium]